MRPPPVDENDMPDDGDSSSARDDDDRDDATGRSPSCAICGTRIDPTAWHPVATRVDGDDEFHLVTFCSDGCRDVWEDG